MGEGGVKFMSGSNVVKAPSDVRLYQVLHLRNGLTALLIHDPLISDSHGAEPVPQSPGAEGEDESSEDDESSNGTADQDEDEIEVEAMDCDGCNSAQHAPDSGCLGELDHEKEDLPLKGSGLLPTKKAAAAMSVGVGSFSDPPDAQGLAHFLEHMLFMGSSKFPNENEYDDFLSKHGGEPNAFTDTEYTCYHFQINGCFLKPALDSLVEDLCSPSSASMAPTN